MENNDFKFIMPAQLIKGEDGEYKIGGLASTESIDRQGEQIIQKGIDLTPVEHGRSFFNFDHSNKPEDVVGTVDGYKKDGKGLYVYGKLFKGHARAEAIYAIMKSLSERNRGAVGLSVEGKVLERDKSNPSVIRKCKISNVAITFSPVNTDTHLSLIKSMTGGEIEFDSAEIHPTAETTEPVEKALGVGVGNAMAPSELSNGDALSMESMDKKKPTKKIKKGPKALFKSQMFEMLDKLQDLYP